MTSPVEVNGPPKIESHERQRIGNFDQHFATATFPIPSARVAGAWLLSREGTPAAEGVEPSGSPLGFVSAAVRTARYTVASTIEGSPASPLVATIHPPSAPNAGLNGRNAMCCQSGIEPPCPVNSA